jgi:hypothetical protein
VHVDLILDPQKPPSFEDWTLLSAIARLALYQTQAILEPFLEIAKNLLKLLVGN